MSTSNLAILEGELGAVKIKKLARQTKNLAKKATKPFSQIARIVKKEIYARAQKAVQNYVSAFVRRQLSPAALLKNNTAVLVGKIQPLVQSPVVSALSLIPGAQPLIPFAPEMIAAASYKVIDDLKKKLIKKSNNDDDEGEEDELNGDFIPKLSKSDYTAIVLGLIVLINVKKRKF